LRKEEIGAGREGKRNIEEGANAAKMEGAWKKRRGVS
jgi:hypothetical protein